MAGRLIERRRWIRFPLQLLTCVKSGRAAVEGVTVNVSGGGALIRTQSELRPGTEVEAHLDWPVSLEQCKLKLVMTGFVVWTREFLTAICAQRYEFRTVSRGRNGR